MALESRRRWRVSPEEDDEDLDSSSTSSNSISSSSHSNYSRSPNKSRSPRRHRRKPWGPARGPFREKADSSAQRTVGPYNKATDGPDDVGKDKTTLQPSLIVRLPFCIVSQNKFNAEEKKLPVGGLRDLGRPRERRQSTYYLPSFVSQDDSLGTGITYEQTRRHSLGRRGSESTSDMAPGVSFPLELE